MGERYAFGVDEPWKAWVAYAKAGWDTITRQTYSITCKKPWVSPKCGSCLSLLRSSCFLCAGTLSRDGTAIHIMIRMLTRLLDSHTLATVAFQTVRSRNGSEVPREDSWWRHTGKRRCSVQVLNSLTASSLTSLQQKREVQGSQSERERNILVVPLLHSWWKVWIQRSVKSWRCSREAVVL